ncbi:hypothetical protein CKO36_09015 [Rhabdochromatium marinum]|nr:hypothetical protein [Rhabdochromatium marinum]
MMSMLAISSVQDTVSYNQVTNNIQFRKSAEAAAQVAIERAIANPDTTFADTDYPFSYTDYTITVGNQSWIARVTAVYLGNSPPEDAPGTSLMLTGLATGSGRDYWDLVATINDTATNTSVEVHQGFAAPAID